MLGDQVISPGLYRDALLLSHLARSIFSASCKAAIAQGIVPTGTVESCAVEGRLMASFGDRDTMAQLGRLYRRVATDIGATDKLRIRIEDLTPAIAAGEAFDLVGNIVGVPPSARITGDPHANPFMIDFLTLPGPGTVAKSSSVPLIGILAVGVVVAGIAVGWTLTRS